MAFGNIVIAGLVLFIGHAAYGLITNYQKARKIHLPILISPVAALNPLWWLTGPILFPIMKQMPHPFSSWAQFGNTFWQFDDKHKTADRFGPAWILVTPSDITVNLNDAKAADEYLSRTKHFLKPPIIYESINFYGPNVDTVNGETWQRHRRLTTPPFNEKNSAIVWRESLGQAKDMLAEWEGEGEHDGAKMSADTTKLALHVLSGAGFGQSYKFAGGMTSIAEGHSMSYADSLASILRNMLIPMVASKVNAPSFLLPKFIKDMKIAMAEFKQYMVEMVEEERALIKAGRPDQKENLMSVLVRANESSRSEGKERCSLTDEEIYGNLFIWNLAGHDTTAKVLAYAMTLLSVNLPVQEWLSEEINQVFGDRPAENWNYKEDFPKLKRCLALMHETLRVYSPVSSMFKYTEDTQQSLTIQGREYDFPPQCNVSLNLVSLHTDPKTWGSDVLTWKPSRFIDSIHGEETLLSPSDGSFIPWASGPRVCPGRKFAQVEFVAVMATAFKNNRVRVEMLAGESMEQAKQRVIAAAEDSEIGASPVLKMRHPEKIRLLWEKKS
ncbi:putative glutamate carboxypeptidase [Venturia inaequalis]|nr:putative glutamate carboxypeptidase [Venturia inaequalis]